MEKIDWSEVKVGDTIDTSGGRTGSPPLGVVIFSLNTGNIYTRKGPSNDPYWDAVFQLENYKEGPHCRYIVLVMPEVLRELKVGDMVAGADRHRLLKGTVVKDKTFIGYVCDDVGSIDYGHGRVLAEDAIVTVQILHLPESSETS